MVDISHKLNQIAKLMENKTLVLQTLKSGSVQTFIQSELLLHIWTCYDTIEVGSQR